MRTERYFRPAVTALILVMVLMATGCNDPFMYNFVRGCGNLTTEMRDAGEFNSVDLRVAADVIIYEDDANSILIEADRNLMQYIATDMAGRTLYLQSRKNIRQSSNRITIYIGMPQVKELRVSGSGTITAEDILESDELLLGINGSGSITTTVNTDRLRSEISGSGNLLVDGTAPMHKIEVKGSGKVKARNLDNDICEVKVMGSGNSYVRVKTALNAEIAGSGDIYISGSPRINATVNGTGRIIELPE